MAIKRILHIVGQMNRGGAETMIMNLYRAIDKNKYQFDFLYFIDKKCDFDDEIISLGGSIYKVHSSNQIQRSIETYKFLKSHNIFHAIHSHNVLASWTSILAAYFAGCKNRVVHSHSTMYSKSNTLIGKLYMIFSKKIINNYSTKYVSCGIEAAEYLFPGKQGVIQLPNSVDVNYLNGCGENNKNYLHELLNIDASKLIITQVGSLTKVKNHDFSIKLAKKLKEGKIDFHMVFAGDGNLREKLIQQSKEENVYDNISFLGLRNDVPNIMAGSDIVIMPSLHEGFPVTLVESQSVGVHAIISDKISSEVDLGVKLISFKSIDNIDEWVSFISNFKRTRHNKNRVDIISSKGFDINNSVKILDDIYK